MLHLLNPNTQAHVTADVVDLLWVWLAVIPARDSLATGKQPGQDRTAYKDWSTYSDGACWK